MQSVSSHRSLYSFPDIVCCFLVFAALRRGIVCLLDHTAGLYSYYMSAITEPAGLRPGDATLELKGSATLSTVAVCVCRSRGCINEKDWLQWVIAVKQCVVVAQQYVNVVLQRVGVWLQRGIVLQQDLIAVRLWYMPKLQLSNIVQSSHIAAQRKHMSVPQWIIPVRRSFIVSCKLSKQTTYPSLQCSNGAYEYCNGSPRCCDSFHAGCNLSKQPGMPRCSAATAYMDAAMGHPGAATASIQAATRANKPDTLLCSATMCLNCSALLSIWEIMYLLCLAMRHYKKANNHCNHSNAPVVHATTRCWQEMVYSSREVGWVLIVIMENLKGRGW